MTVYLSFQRPLSVLDKILSRKTQLQRGILNASYLYKISAERIFANINQKSMHQPINLFILN